MITIESIANAINNVLEKARPALSVIPPFILACGILRRPGLSSINIAANIIRRQSEAGAPSGAMPDGSRNVSEGMEVIRIEELLKALKLDAKVSIAVPPGAITFMGFGANAGGPVTVQGFNTSAFSASGIIQ